MATDETIYKEVTCAGSGVFSLFFFLGRGHDLRLTKKTLHEEFVKWLAIKIYINLDLWKSHQLLNLQKKSVLR